jgi:Zn-finger nucleic acid-binding protein
MICPACKGVVVVVEYERIELDYCTHCGGVWFDTGELELLAERLSLDGQGLTMEEIIALPERKVSEKRRRCPICRRRMRKVVIGSDPEVLVDVCPVGDGTWFDGGEVAQVLSQLHGHSPPSGGQGRVINFLGEVFEARA